MGVHTKKRKPISRAESAARPLINGRARPRYQIDLDVYEAALQRVRWLFDEFDNKVSVSNSGGKDSTVVLELAAKVNAERGLPPLRVMWLDQECEFDATVRYQRYIAQREDIDFHWYQIPFRLYNATNHDDPWLNVWGEGEEWVREKEPYSIHENPFTKRDGTPVDRFKEVLAEINIHSGGGAILTGMRSEESPARRLTMTTKPMYKWVTWCSEGHKRKGFEPYYMFHPIYDWMTRDVWKAIHDNDWVYNDHYDTMFRYGVPTKNMRVSNYHHETALSSLLYLQEAEPETWEKATSRLAGVNTFGQLKNDVYVKDLPYMFKDWEEYLHHLIDNLVPSEEYRETFRKQYTRMLNALPDFDKDRVAQVVTSSVLSNDLYGTKIDMFLVTNSGKSKARKKQAEEQELAFTGGSDE